MSRLIDADVFEVVCFQGKSDEFLEGAKYILEMIDAQPTAYDVEKVVAELEEAVESYCSDYHGVDYIEPERAIEIVKRGGAE